MRSKGQLYFGAVILVIGVLLLFGRLVKVSFGRFFWPLLLIGGGIWLIMRPRMVGPDTEFSGRVLGDIRREGPWTVRNEEIWFGVGDIKLDMTEAEVPFGETSISIYGFMGDIDLTVPEDVGLLVNSTAFVSSTKMLGEKRDYFLSTARLTSPNYEEAERRIRLQVTCFVADLDIRRG